MSGTGDALRRRAYTLIEVLAVIVVLGLVFAVLVPGLAAGSDRAVVESFVADVIELDSRARLVAQRSGGAVIEHAQTGFVLREMEDGESVSMLRIPELVNMEWRPATDRLVFDAVGAADDYGVLITSGGRSHAIRFNGRTGWYAREGSDE